MPTIDVLDSTIHYEESGSGPALVLLHGNPGSSHELRKVMADLGDGWLLAPDLIGMGRSGKPDIAYSFADQARYLDAWFDARGLDRVILTGHDLGRRAGLRLGGPASRARARHRVPRSDRQADGVGGPVAPGSPALRGGALARR